MTRATRAGFTLIELLVALVVAGILTLLAARLFAIAADASRLVYRERRALDREMNARRWLASAFQSLDVGTEGAAQFDGKPDRVAFSTWLMTSDGWLERRPVLLQVASERLIASSAADTVVLVQDVDLVAFDYLLVQGAQSRWVSDWTSTTSGPVAVRVRLRHSTVGPRSSTQVDTMLYLAWPHG